MPPTRKTRKKKSRQNMLIVGVSLIAILIAGVSIFYAVSPLSPFVTVTETETPTATTTIKLISYQDGEDVSNFVEVSIWTNDEDAEFDDTEDIYTMSNFEETESSKDADDVSIDLSDYDYVWIEIDPDAETAFSTTWYLVYGGVNYAYSLYVYHLTSDVNFNALDRDTMNELTLGDYDTDANITLVMDCPHHTTTNIHANSDDWAVDDEEWDDMTESEKDEYYDEKYWRSQAPLYVPADDDEKEFDDDLEKLTEAFALKFDFNGTISTTDGNAAQVNMTVNDDDLPIEVIISGDLIYLVFYETISFETGDYDFDLEVEFGDDIHLDDIDSGRIEVPRDDDNLGTFTKYSDIAA